MKVTKEGSEVPYLEIEEKATNNRDLCGLGVVGGGPEHALSLALPKKKPMKCPRGDRLKLRERRRLCNQRERDVGENEIKNPNKTTVERLRRPLDQRIGVTGKNARKNHGENNHKRRDGGGEGRG